MQNSLPTKHLKGLHVAHLVVTPIGKTVAIRIANTTKEAIELQQGCKLAEFCFLITQTIVAKNKFPIFCHAVKTDRQITQQIDSSIPHTILSPKSTN